MIVTLCGIHTLLISLHIDNAYSLLRPATESLIFTSICIILYIIYNENIYYIIYIFNVYLFLRERDRVQAGGGAGREGDTESESGSRL